MQMLFFRSRKTGQDIGWPYYIEEEQGVAIAQYVIGDEVSISFFSSQEIYDKIRSQPELNITVVETGFPSDESDNQYTINVNCQVAGRRHGLFTSKKHSDEFRESLNSIYLEPMTDQDEATLLLLIEHAPPRWTQRMPEDQLNLTQLPETASFSLRTASHTTGEKTGGEETMNLDALVDFLHICFRSFPEAQNLTLGQLSRAVEQASSRYGAVRLPGLLEAVQELLRAK